MKVNEVLACSFPKWYSVFKKVTFPSKIIPLPEEFLSYLLADNFILQSDLALLKYNNDESSSDSEGDEEEWAKAEVETPSLEAPRFEEIDRHIKTTIAEFGGQVFIKLNWSSPKDAAWIALNNSLGCHLPADVYLLLKSSDFILHDLTEPFKDCEDATLDVPKVEYVLILRKYFDINPANEYRCFVRHKKLIGICQRDESQFYAHIEKEKEDIVDDVTSFFKKEILPKFSLENYVFDIVRHHKDNVLLVDFNPYGITTDSLLFDWEDLQADSKQEEESNISCDKPDFRCVTEEAGIRNNPLRRYCVPEDIHHLTSGEDPFKLMDLLKLQTQRPETEDSD